MATAINKAAPVSRGLLYDVIAQMGNHVRAVLDGRDARIEARLAALEQKVAEGLEYEGVYEEGRAYRRNSCVTDRGCLWVALNVTSQRPGDGPDWQLAVKRGRDAR